MSREVLEQLRERTAFKPAPPEFEMAAAHVSPASVGLDGALDQRVYDAMCADDEAFVVIQGAPGWGKSSVLTSAAYRAAKETTDPQVLPLRIGVGHHVEPITPALLVRSVTHELALRLGPELKNKDRERLERSMAITITKTKTSPAAHAGLSAPIPHLPALGASLAVDLGGDLVQLVSAGADTGNPTNQLVALRDLAAARGARLVIILDDTDTWVEGAEQLAPRARDFFLALRALAHVPEITTFVAVQDHWAGEDAGAKPNTAAARNQYQALAERAARLLHVPRPDDEDQAQRLIVAILDRRAEITLDRSCDGGWTWTLFEEAAITLLAERTLTFSIRQALADIRNAFDHTPELPDRITAEHLRAAMG